VQVDLGGRRVEWDMTMAPETSVPIELDTTQKLTLMVKTDQLVVDSSQVARYFPISLEERAA
jgi:hypothetical protein